MDLGLKTSAEWSELDVSGIIVLDPDGWDRSNYQYSYYEEKITHDEYLNRRMFSTVLFNQSNVAKQGDSIMWHFPENENHPDKLKGKTFKANVAVVNLSDREYGVYAEYGQDYISFDKALLVKQ